MVWHAVSLQYITLPYICSAIDDRVLIRDKETRDLLLSYARATQLEPLADTDGRKLRKLLGDDHWRQLFTWIDTLSKGTGRRFPPPALARLLEGIAHPSPVSGLILRPAEMAPLLRNIANSKILSRAQPKELSLLQDNCPALFELLHSTLCQSPSGQLLATFPLEMHPLLLWLAESCDRLVKCESRGSMHLNVLIRLWCTALPAAEQKAPCPTVSISIDQGAQRVNDRLNRDRVLAAVDRVEVRLLLWPVAAEASPRSFLCSR